MLTKFCNFDQISQFQPNFISSQVGQFAPIWRENWSRSWLIGNKLSRPEALPGLRIFNVKLCEFFALGRDILLTRSIFRETCAAAWFYFPHVLLSPKYVTLRLEESLKQRCEVRVEVGRKNSPNLDPSCCACLLTAGILGWFNRNANVSVMSCKSGDKLFFSQEIQRRPGSAFSKNKDVLKIYKENKFKTQRSLLTFKAPTRVQRTPKEINGKCLNR